MSTLVSPQVGHIEETAKSSVKITCNAKGEAQPEIKVYEGADAGEIDRIRQLAVKAYCDTQREVRRSAA